MIEEIKKKVKKSGPKRGRKKLTLVFDENARREFLTGFHKRKLQRKKKAEEEFEKLLKAERKRIKAEAKEQYMKLLLGKKLIPKIIDLQSQEIDMGTHAVSVTELSVSDLAKKNNWIGVNEGHYKKKVNEDLIQLGSETEQQIKGMEVKRKRKSKSNNISGKSLKDIKKKIKQQASVAVKSSKVFKKKFQLERIKNIKLKRRKERQAEKTIKKNKRSSHSKSK